MSSPIVVRALEAELARVADRCVGALVRCSQLREGSRGKERERLDDARALINAAAADYDAVQNELTLAKRAISPRSTSLGENPTETHSVAVHATPTRMEMGCRDTKGESVSSSPSSRSTASAPLVDHSTGWGPK